MTIRAATLADMDELIDLIKEFKDDTPYADQIISDEHFVTFLTHYLTPRPAEHIVLVLEKNNEIVGLIAGAITAGLHFFSENKVAGELAWYVSPAHRNGTGPIRLLHAYEDWAELMGCTKVSLSVLETEHRPTLSKMYRKLGYNSVEETFVRDI